MTTKLVRVAAVQASSIAFNLPASLAKLQTVVGAAKEGGAQLVVLPEAFLSAYPRHLGFEIGSRSAEIRDWYGRYVRSSVKVPDAVEGRDWLGDSAVLKETDDFWAFQQLCKLAKRHSLHLSIGVIEASLIGSTLWCTNLLFGPTGQLLSKHRKLQPTAAERIVWSQGEGTNGPMNGGGDSVAEGNGQDNLPVVQTEIGKIGGLICWENFMPLPRYLLYKKGIEIYTAPTADGRTTWLPSMQHIAQEGRCFVISANQYHTSADFPADYPPNVTMSSVSPSGEKDKPEVWSRGGSCIVNPLGEVLAGPLWDEEGIIYADLDLDSLHGAKLDFDPVGHYSREDLMMKLLGST